MLDLPDAFLAGRPSYAEYFHYLAEARNSGKTYLVGRAATGTDAIYVFACDHPDARNAPINIMYDCPPKGIPTRRPGIRNATRH